MGNGGRRPGYERYVILALVALLLLGGCMPPSGIHAETRAPSAQEMLLSADELGASWSLLNEGDYAAWKSSAAWKQVSLSEKGLLDSSWRLYQGPGQGYGAPRLREHVLLYDSPEDAGVALSLARDAFLGHPTYLQEGGLNETARPYVPVVVMCGDETWAVAWTDSHGVHGYAALVRYGHTLLMLTASGGELTFEAVQQYHRLAETRIPGDTQH